MIEQISQLLEDPIHSDLPAGDFAALREMRTKMQAAEADLSLVRRLTQGRMDIVGHEVASRENREATGEVDAADVLFELPDILADSPAASRSGRLQINEPGPVAHEMITKLDALISPNQLSSISDVSDQELHNYLGSLKGFEEQLSGGRRGLHEKIDNIQREIGSRYASGAASTEDAFRN